MDGTYLPTCTLSTLSTPTCYRTRPTVPDIPKRQLLTVVNRDDPEILHGLLSSSSLSSVSFILIPDFNNSALFYSSSPGVFPRRSLRGIEMI